VAEWPNAAVC